MDDLDRDAGGVADELAEAGDMSTSDGLGAVPMNPPGEPIVTTNNALTQASVDLLRAVRERHEVEFRIVNHAMDASFAYELEKARTKESMAYADWKALRP